MKLELPHSKRALVDKANSTVIVVVAVAAVVITFCLVTSKSLWDQRGFQSRVIEKKSIALDQLNANIAATDSLVNSYTAFVSEQPNIIGGNSSGEGPKDGDNARIVLDALPSQYDFPALATSIEKIVRDQGLPITSISGIDDQLQQNEAEGTSVPQPVEIPFEFSYLGTFENSQKLFDTLQKSIRPFHILSFTFSGTDGANVAVEVNAKTYYQPEKKVDITTETIQ